MVRGREGSSGTGDLAEVFPELSGNGGYPLRALSWPELKRQDVQLLFLGTPHEASRALVPEAIAQGLRVIDLSGAWRLKDRKSTRLNSSHQIISYAVFCLKKKKRKI